MAGTLRGDFSRRLFDPARRDSAVHLQQGRAVLDADWNAQVDLAAHRLRTGTRDVVGAAGAPAEDPGFEIVPRTTLAFDGPEQRLVLDGDDLGDLTAAGFTFEAWVAPRSTGHRGLLLSRLGRSGPEDPFALDLSLSFTADGRLQVHRRGERFGQLISARAVSFDRTHHVALVASRRQCALYLDGEPAGSDGEGVPPASPDTVFVVGSVADPGGRHRAFEGPLYGLRMWTVPRTQDEIQHHHRHPRSEAREDLLGSWLCEGHGPEDVLPDRAGGRHAWWLGGGRSELRPGTTLRQVEVGAGRFYVDGLLCRNERTVAFERQPDHPGAVLPELRPGDAHLFYLDVWERTVTGGQDPNLLDPALGGADTTVRSRIVSQVKTLPLPRPPRSATADPSAAAPAAPGDAWLEAWTEHVRRSRHQGRLAARRAPSANALGNRLYRVEIHSRGTPWGWPRPEGVRAAEIEVRTAGGEGSRVRVCGGPWDDWRPGAAVEVFSPETDSQDRPGIAASIVATEPDQSELHLDADLGPLAAHSRILMRPLATFKWSRRNSSVAYPVVRFEPGSQVVALGTAGQRCLDLEVGDVVEVCDRDSELESRVERLLRIVELDETTLDVTLDGTPTIAPVTGDGPSLAPILRRWDQKPHGDRPLVGGAVPLAPGTWLPIETGIEVRFEDDGPYRPGTYWQIPARSATDDLLWPKRQESPEAREPAAVTPHGVEHHYAPLAVLALGDGGFRLRDCRRIFHPLTTGAVSKAGDTMDGPLEIRSDLTVEGDVRAGALHGPLGSAGAVASLNLADGAVTAPKLAPDLGIVPPGYLIFGETPETPPGYASTGLSLTLTDHDAAWRARAPLPRAEEGPLQGAVVAGRVYLAFESGRLWEYDPETDRWSARRPNPYPLHGSAAAAAGGLLVVAGGEDPDRSTRGTVMTYDPGTDLWSIGTDMPTPRSHLALAELDGCLHAVGGLRRGLLGTWATRRHERYDPLTGRWTRRAALPRGRYALGAESVAGRLHAVGGARRGVLGLWGRALTNAHAEYEPAADRWRPAAPLPTPRVHPGIAAVAGRLWAVGGEGLFGRLADSEEYDPELDRWRRRPPAPEPMNGPALGAVGGRLLALGCLGYGAEAVVGAWESAVAVRLSVHRKLPPDENGDVELVTVPREPGSRTPARDGGDS